MLPICAGAGRHDSMAQSSRAILLNTATRPCTVAIAQASWARDHDPARVLYPVCRACHRKVTFAPVCNR